MDLLLSSVSHFIFDKAVPFVILLGILVFVHELGHFLVARLNGVRVEVFSLGFGKKIFTFKRGDTVYAISLIPLGGYVKMFGEQPGDAIAESDKAVSFTHKTVLQRMSIVLAGPLMNLFFAVFLFALAASLGEEKKPAILGDVSISSEAFTDGFRPGDEILKVGGQPIHTWDQLQDKLNEFKGESVPFEVKSAQQQKTTTLTAQIDVVPNPNPLAFSREAGAIKGFQFYSTGTIVGVTKGSTLDSLGIKTGDILKSINGHEIKYWRNLEAFVDTLKTGEPLSLVFDRPSTSQDVQKEEPLTINVTAPSKPLLSHLGIEKSDLYLAKVFEGSPADKAGLKDYDRLLAINGKTLTSWDDVLNTVKDYTPRSGPVKFEVLRNGEKLEIAVTPHMTTQMTPGYKEEKRFTVGIAPLIELVTEKSLIVRHNPFSALWVGVRKSTEVTVMTVMSFVRLVAGDISAKNVGGVLSIGQAASESFKAGFNYFIQMMGAISISLFVLNLLPIPVLDGGHILFYTIELLKGSPMSLRKMELAQQVGLVLLMSLMLFALFNDVNRVFFGSY